MIGEATAALTLPEWSKRTPETCPALAGLVLDARSRALAKELDRQRIVTVRERYDGLEVQSYAFVGRLRVGPVQVTMHPKLGGRPLRQLFRYAYALDDLERFESTSFHEGGALFPDLLAEQLLGEVEELLRRGLRRAYERREGWLPTVRGRVDVGRLAAAGGTVRAALPCAYHERVEDSQLNRVVLAGLWLAARACESGALATQLRRLARLLQTEVGRLRLSAAVLSEAKRGLDRLTAGYGPALELITLLYEGHDPALLDEPGRTLRLPGFAFDMNRFFQALMLRLLRETLAPLEVRDERGLTGMFAYEPGANPQGRQAPTPRPDFTVFDGRRVVGILDAKYRDLWERSLPREMLYQLALYAVGQGDVDEAVILYPTLAVGAKEARIGLRDPVKGGRLGTVVVRPVRLDEVAAWVGGDTPSLTNFLWRAQTRR